MPKRIQMRRDRPWRREHPGAVIVARPSKWGNPFKVGDHGIEDREDAVLAFDVWAGHRMDHRCGDKGVFADLAELRGRDLACWCPLNQPCHADVLLRLANTTMEK